MIQSITLDISNNKVNNFGNWWIDWFLMAFQLVWGYFMLKGKRIAFMVHFWWHFLQIFFILLYTERKKERKKSKEKLEWRKKFMIKQQEQRRKMKGRKDKVRKKKKNKMKEGKKKGKLQERNRFLIATDNNVIRTNYGPGDLGSIPGWVIPKTQKMVLDANMLNTQHYKVRIKGKVEKSRERSSALLYTLV